MAAEIAGVAGVPAKRKLTERLKLPYLLNPNL